ncbi:MAG TPA: SPFH domain-containing protein [Acidimicrobiales bacterium]|nr:SPFH domain-containing protein [Acidimicrobiales bacterium]
MRQMTRMYRYGMGDVPTRCGRREVVNQWEQALLFRNGALLRTLGTGAYRHWRSGYVVRRVDVRPWILQVPTQEVPTADGVTVKVTVAGRVRVVDPVVYVTGTQEPIPSLYLAVQVALRELVAQATVEQLVAGRADAGVQLLEGVRGVDELGVVVEQLELKDIVLPADLKRAQAQVLIARAEGLAALERARGETAALRNLANAARLCAEQPALLQLRLLQQLASGPGHTVVIGNPPLGTGSPA